MRRLHGGYSRTAKLSDCGAAANSVRATADQFNSPRAEQPIAPSRMLLDSCLAEGVGFEPTSHFRDCRFSRPVHSTALPPLRGKASIIQLEPDGCKRVSDAPLRKRFVLRRRFNSSEGRGWLIARRGTMMSDRSGARLMTALGPHMQSLLGLRHRRMRCT